MNYLFKMLNLQLLYLLAKATKLNTLIVQSKVNYRYNSVNFNCVIRTLYKFHHIVLS